MNNQEVFNRYKHDPYRKALFFALAANDLTLAHIHDLYDFEEDVIRTEGLDKNWQTDTSRKVTRCAFNLYNGYAGETEDEAQLYSICEVLNVDEATRKKLIEASLILFRGA